MPKVCEVCERAEGSTKDRGGHEDGVPLGTLEVCETCGKLACPDCIHEADCCFANFDDDGLCPKGWRPKVSLPGRQEFERIS